MAWAAYVEEYDSDEQVAKREAAAEAARRDAEHHDVMKQAALATRR